MIKKTITKKHFDLLWMSDLHLDFASKSERRRLLEELRKTEYHAAILTGDTAAYPNLIAHLDSLAAACSPRNLYILLGNHDFYGSLISATEAAVRDLCRRTHNIHYLPDLGAVGMGSNAIVIGSSGWADGRLGWGAKTCVRSPDHWCINDFRLKRTMSEKFALMGSLARESSNVIRQCLHPVLSSNKRILIATHVPPFKSSAHYNGKPCGPCHTPHYVNAVMGGMLIAIASRNPETNLSVISGHTHSAIHEHITPNLESHVAGAFPGRPIIQGIIRL